MKCRRPNCPNKATPSRGRGFCAKHYELAPKGLVDSDECRNHVAELRAAGYSMRAIAKLAGLDTDTLTNLGSWTPGGKTRLATHNGIMRIPIPETIVNAGAQRMPNVGVKRRIQALVAAGYPIASLARELGVSHQNVGFWLKRDMVSSETFEKVDDLFRRLQLSPGPSARARSRGKDMGWHPPMAWDDIDDPDEVPTISASKDDWHTNYWELRGMGLNDSRIAERLGVQRDSMLARLRRAA